MKLYHGTSDDAAENIRKNGVDLKAGNRCVDFGPGFYLSPSKDVAIKMAQRRTDSANKSCKAQRHPVVLEFEVDEKALKKLRLREFEEDSAEWSAFVINSRAAGLSSDIIDIDAKYDCVVGPIADGKRGEIVKIAKSVNRGTISSDEIANIRLRPFNIRNDEIQYAILTDSALQCLKLTDIKQIYKEP